MEQPVIDQYLVRKYLLGQLAEGEREWLEERLLTDDEFYETLTALEDQVEDELIEQYLDEELTGEGREHFERLLLHTPERAEKLLLIKDLKNHVAPVPAHAAAATAAADTSDSTATVVALPRGSGGLRGFGLFQHPLFGLSCAAALLLAVLCGGWLFVKSNRLEAELAQARSQSQPAPADGAALQEHKKQLEELRARNAELTASLHRAEEERTRLEQLALAAPLGEVRAPTTPPLRTVQQTPRSFIATLVLSPTTRGIQGSEKLATLALDSFATPTHLVLKVDDLAPGDYPGLRAVLKKSVGGEVWNSDAVKVVTRSRKRREGQVALTLPAGTLAEGQYTLDLEGITDAGATEPISLYSFRVVPKDKRPPTIP